MDLFELMIQKAIIDLMSRFSLEAWEFAKLKEPGFVEKLQKLYFVDLYQAWQERDKTKFRIILAQWYSKQRRWFDAYNALGGKKVC